MSDKSRDYTVPESALLAMQHAAPVWQTSQAGQMYSGGEYAAGSSGRAQQPNPPGQPPSWDPNTQGPRPSFVSAPATFYGGSPPGPLPYSPAGGGPPLGGGGQPTNIQPPYYSR